jgi:cytochrome c553
MRIIALFVLIMVALGAPGAVRAADASAGKIVYDTYCSACHGAASENFNNIWVGANNPTAIQLQIQTPGSAMGYLGDILTATDLANVAAYLAVVAGIAPIDPPLVPAVGLWWNPNESGSGYALDVKHGVLVVTIYSYDKATGNAQWYLAYNPLTNNGHSFSAPLGKYRGGQCISCAYPGSPTYAGDDGTIAIEFSSSTSATVTLPGGRTTAIQPQDF